VHEPERRIGQPHAAPGALEQQHAGLALEHRELLGDGRRREPERVGDRGDRAALAELAQEPQAPEVEHRSATLPIHRHESESIAAGRAATIGAMRSSGTFLCLGSGAAFGAMAVFGKLAYGAGATVGTLLAVRFALAAAVFWALILAAGAARDVLALGRERMDRRRLMALALALGGLALVVAGAGTGALDPRGTALGLGAAVAYSTYILVSDGVAARVAPRLLAALVCTGAAVTLTAGSALLGELRPGALTAAGWGWLACLAVVSTVASIGLFFAGLRRVGPTTASILATVEPLVTVVLAFLVFGETLGPVQLAGGALVLAAVLVLRVPRLRVRVAA